MGPPLPNCVVIFALIAKFVPVNEIPATPLVLTTPLKVVVPAPALCTIDPAVITFAVTLFALVIVSAPTAGAPPTVPFNKILPEVPAISVKLPGPLTVLSVMLFPAGAPLLFVVSIVALPVSVVVPDTPTVPPFVIKEEFPALKLSVPREIAAAAAVVFTVPKTVVVLAVLVNPLVKFKLADPPLFRVTPPVLLKVVAGVIVPPLLNTTA